ncbi:MAG TPA: S1 family peptidase [Polyangiaceae bacterium]
MGAWIALFSVLVCACSGEAVGDGSEAIYGGSVDQGGNDAVVAVKIGAGSPFTLCSGSLVAPNLVLTAWHCVAQTVVSTISCDTQGQSTTGPQLGADVDVASIGIYLGVHPNVYGAADAAGAKIFHATGSVMCNDDVAFVALDRSLAPAPLALRLSPAARVGETLAVVGYGQNDGSFGTAVRVVKTGLDVLGVGAGTSASNTPLGSNEFELGESTCQGDSGGPVLDASGAIVGVVTRGGACSDSYGHVFVEPSGETAVMNAAFAFVSATPLEEPIASAPDAGGGGGGGLRSGVGQNACSARIAPAAPGNRGSAAAWLVALAFVLLRFRRAD